MRAEVGLGVPDSRWSGFGLALDFVLRGVLGCANVGVWMIWWLWVMTRCMPNG